MILILFYFGLLLGLLLGMGMGMGMRQMGTTSRQQYFKLLQQQFQITDVSQYDVDWDAVSNAFTTNVEISLVYSGVLALALYFYLFSGNSYSNAGSEE